MRCNEALGADAEQQRGETRPAAGAQGRSHAEECSCGVHFVQRGNTESNGMDGIEKGSKVGFDAAREDEV